MPLHALRHFRFDFIFWLGGSGSARASLEPDTPESHDHDHGRFIRSFIFWHRHRHWHRHTLSHGYLYIGLGHEYTQHVGFLRFCLVQRAVQVGNQRMIFHRLCLLSLIYLNLTFRLWYRPIIFLLAILQSSSRLCRQHAERFPCPLHFSICLSLNSNLVPRPATTAILPAIPLATSPARGSRLAAAQ